MIIFKCECCGFERGFETAERSFAEGWDTPPYFSGYVTCNLCPSSHLLLGISHQEAHDRWAKCGRPGWSKCTNDSESSQTIKSGESNVENQNEDRQQNQPADGDENETGL